MRDWLCKLLCSDWCSWQVHEATQDEQADQSLALIKEAGCVKPTDLSRREFLRLPMEERRKILAKQAQELADNV